MAPILRPRTDKIKPSTYSTAVDTEGSSSPTVSDISPTSTAKTTPPVYIIDLSLPPSQRYVEVARAYKDSLSGLQHLFDDITQLIPVPNWFIHVMACLLLRRVYSTEQTEELRGISHATSVPMYLLVAYNVLLDLFMGCTSGGACVQAPDATKPRMMHFRTLDWGMPELRNVIVQYNFIERPRGPVIASTVSYVGFVGVLTGVRKDISVSLNFRPYHNNDTSLWTNAKFRFHQLAVLLGFRPSIASMLRDFIIPRTLPPYHVYNLQTVIIGLPTRPFYDSGTIFTTFSETLSTAAYLVFCTPQAVRIMEKDLATARVRSSMSFMAVTNHDVAYEKHHNEAAHTAYAMEGIVGDGMRELVEESVERKRCLVEKWEERSKSAQPGQDIGVALEELKEWMLAFPTSNEMTHFVCIMDPLEGKIRWVRCFEEGDNGGEEDEDAD
ncbi:beta subunit of N-acylethanolamine-hydrolyzing acid amidase-domain-containing protein [Phaeosphaeria sp. MPI-PUGE-AT-0046c]|nr:beta subunit of N-acylethanolamine-hydrolyzing acid amidase-domain-containing protein [Phaeosphaeria sp. MPI-PUGE-AT-0046c]